MENKDVVTWFNQTLTPKKLKLESLKDLKSGSLFLQTLHIYFPKYVSLQKSYLHPKNTFQLLQNYRQLSNIFSQLNWKKIDPQKYVKQQDKDCLDLASFLVKKLTAERRNRSKNISFSQIQLGEGSKANWSEIGSPGIEEVGLGVRIGELQRKKQALLDKLMGVEHVLEEAVDAKIARGLILKILEE